MQRGWFSYSQAAEPGVAPGPLPAPQPLRPELADVGRLGRRLLHGVVRTARAEQNDALGRHILEHLGGDAGGLPVVQESWPGYEQVNVQLGLDAWLSSAREVELLGVIGFRAGRTARHAQRDDARAARRASRRPPRPRTGVATMCRNIRVLHNFEPAATDEEVRAAALQYVRKVSGTTKPSLANQAAFDEAVAEIAHVTQHLLDHLVTTAPPRDREVERARALARNEQRFGPRG